MSFMEICRGQWMRSITRSGPEMLRGIKGNEVLVMFTDDRLNFIAVFFTRTLASRVEHVTYRHDDHYKIKSEYGMWAIQAVLNPRSEAKELNQALNLLLEPFPGPKLEVKKLFEGGFTCYKDKELITFEGLVTELERRVRS